MHTAEHLPVEVAGVGSYLPERVLSNFDLEEMVDTSDEWIVPRTGIRERRIAAEDQATSDLAVAAARDALARAGLTAEQLDAVLVATCTPDHLFPATACLVQDAIGATNAMACDLEAACSGFVYGFVYASGLIASGMAQNILVIGAETLSRVTDYTDRRTCILFGDGAGAAILRPSQNGGRMLYAELGADGSRPEILEIPAGGTRLPASHETVDARRHYMQLQGREVFKLAVNKLIELMQRIPERAGVSLDDIKMVLPHQSNVRIIKSALERSGLELEKAYMNIDSVGNTSAASIPLAFAEAVERGELERGDLALLLAFGGGLTWGSALFRF
ncbi:MAG: beta-ketoacyl-ACP synthase III [Candidatus Brocadiia bacterium]